MRKIIASMFALVVCLVFSGVVRAQCYDNGFDSSIIAVRRTVVVGDGGYDPSIIAVRRTVVVGNGVDFSGGCRTVIVGGGFGGGATTLPVNDFGGNAFIGARRTVIVGNSGGFGGGFVGGSRTVLVGGGGSGFGGSRDIIVGGNNNRINVDSGRRRGGLLGGGLFGGR